MQPKPGTNQPPLPETTPVRKHERRFNLRDHLHRIAGVDITKIDGLEVQTVQIILSEVGVDMSRWNTEKGFASWLGLCPDNRVSGGKPSFYTETAKARLNTAKARFNKVEY